MAAARIAAVFLAAILPLAGAQQPPQTRLTVQVTDPSGACIPGAQVEVTSPTSAVSIASTTDSRGVISLKLDPGSYHLSATSPGFCPGKQTIEVLRQAMQSFPIQLTVGGCPSECMSGCVTVTSETPAQERQTRLTVQVTDVTGAVIPDAQIKINPPLSAGGPTLRTNSEGQAKLDTPAGSYTLSITHPGFKKWTRQIDIQGAVDQMVKVTLEIDPSGSGYQGPCCFDVPLQLGTDLVSVESADLIPLRPVGNFTPLPSHGPKKR